MSVSNANATAATVKSRLQAVIALAGLLERMDRSASAVDADQYRLVVTRLQAALSDDLPTDALNAVLGAHPAAAEVYENLHYAQSGLSRSPLDRSVATETLAAQTLARLSRLR